ncbi:MAG: secretion system protein F [Clostridiales bacterium]|nr:secretion system protein F [Clostridiales bacterium]
MKVSVPAAVLGVILVLLGVYLDYGQGNQNTNQLERSQAGEDSLEYSLILDAEDVTEDYEYLLTVDAMMVDTETALDYMEQARQEIDESFYADGEDADCVTLPVNMADSYVEGIVTAEWYLDDYDVMDTGGNIVSEDLDEEGTVVTASVQLSCYEYKELYQFAFVVYPSLRSKTEQLLYDINKNIREQLSQTGQQYLTLPSEVDGVSLSWSVKKEKYFWKLFLLAAALVTGLPIVQKERQKEDRKKREMQMQMDYPVIVSKLLILYSSGMSVSQIWNRMSSSYLKKRKQGEVQVRYAYEEMVRANRQILDGESETEAWLAFGERIGMQCYYRFVRLLVENRRKGAAGWSSQLEREAEESFEERRNLARKLGEEAGTKLLFPMIMMFAIVMAIVIMPAVVNYML